MKTLCFPYGGKETEYLKSKDKKLAAVIDRIGHIERSCYDDLFEAVVNSIIGQQISTKAHESIWKKSKRNRYGWTLLKFSHWAGRSYKPMELPGKRWTTSWSLPKRWSLVLSV